MTAVSFAGEVLPLTIDHELQFVSDLSPANVPDADQSDEANEGTGIQLESPGETAPDPDGQIGRVLGVLDKRVQIFEDSMPGVARGGVIPACHGETPF
jgi:hypothetical protein